MITTILLNSVALVAIIFAINNLFMVEGMLFERIGKYLMRNVNQTILKPIIRCPRCMASVWGLLYSLLILPFTAGIAVSTAILLSPLIMLIASGLIIIIDNLTP